MEFPVNLSSLGLYNSPFFSLYFCRMFEHQFFGLGVPIANCALCGYWRSCRTFYCWCFNFFVIPLTNNAFHLITLSVYLYPFDVVHSNTLTFCSSIHVWIARYIFNRILGKIPLKIKFLCHVFRCHWTCFLVFFFIYAGLRDLLPSPRFSRLCLGIFGRYLFYASKNVYIEWR